MSSDKCVYYYLPPRLRRDFSRPRGIVKRGDFLDFIPSHAPSIICVGDIVSNYCKRLKNNNIIFIIDKKTKRNLIIEKSLLNEETFILKNPPGHISSCAYKLLCNLITSRNRTTILVRGEEDLLALPAIACSPPGGIVVYGIPDKGAAIISVNKFLSAEAQSRLLRLEPRGELT